MKTLVVVLQIAGAFAAAFSLVAGVMWARQDKRVATQRESDMDSLRGDISDLENQADGVRGSADRWRMVV